MQVRMNQNLLRAAPGMMAGSLNNRKIDSRLASGTVYAGKAVCPYAATEVNSDLQRAKLPASVANVVACEGVSVWSPAMASDDDVGYAYYATGEMMPVMKQGEVWVEVGDAIVDLGAPVYVRHSNGNLTQVFTLTIQAGAAADKVYSFYLEAPDGSRTLISHTSVDDVEATVATAVAALIDAVDDVGASASGSDITVTAANADEKWKCVGLVAADIVLTGETSPTVGTLGSFRSTQTVVQTQTITITASAADRVRTTQIIGPDGATYLETHIDADDVEATSATAIAALINAISGLSATADAGVITVTADNLDELWTITSQAGAVVADTTSTNYAIWDKAEWTAYEEVDGVFFGKLKIKN